MKAFLYLTLIIYPQILWGNPTNPPDEDTVLVGITSPEEEKRVVISTLLREGKIKDEKDAFGRVVWKNDTLGIKFYMSWRVNKKDLQQLIKESNPTATQEETKSSTTTTENTATKKETSSSWCSIQ